MVDLQVATTTGTATIPEAALEEFKSGLGGQIILPGDEGYDEARTVHNAMIDKRPGLIVRCAGVSDVIGSVNFARDNSLLVSVRGGGHNIAGKSVCDGGIVIDLSRMKGIRVDAAGRTARAEGGVTWGEFDRETQTFGLATTGGVVTTTGIAGLTLGGGLGWLVRKHGLACDNLSSFDVVTADGRFLTASATENADLFWGTRGGGGNFGIVTSFEYRLHPVGPTVLGGMVIHPIEKAKEVLKFYRAFTSEAPDELTTQLGLLTSPDGNPIIAIPLCYSGPIEAGEQVIRPLREFGPPVADLIQPMPYRQVQAMFDPGFQPGFHNYWKSNFMKEISDGAIDTIVAHVATVPSPHTFTLIENFGGAVARVGAEDTAFNHRDSRYNFGILSIWSDPADSQRNVEWTRNFLDAMQPFCTDEVYVNYTSDDETEDRIKAAYGGAAKYGRLAALKNKYDPTNLFRLNQNIKPTV